MGKKDAKGIDSRFAAVHSDPRFQRFPRAKAKVEIDERFEGALAHVVALTRSREPRPAHATVGPLWGRLMG